MLANLIKRGFSERIISNSLKRYGQQRKRVIEKRRSIIQEIEQDLKSIEYVSMKGGQQSGQIGKTNSSHLENPLFQMINTNSAQIIHQDVEIGQLLLSSIKNLFKSNRGDPDGIASIFRLTRNPLFMTEQIHSFLMNELNQMLREDQFTTFSKCIKGNKKFFPFFLCNKINYEKEMNMKDILSVKVQLEIDMKGDMQEQENDNKDHENSLSVEQNQKNKLHKNLLDSEWEEQHQMSGDRKNVSDKQEQEQDEYSRLVVLQDIQDEKKKYEIRDDFLKLVDIEYSNSGDNFYSFLVKRMQEQNDFYALYLLLKMNERDQSVEKRDDVLVNNYIKHITALKRQEILSQLIDESLMQNHIQVDNLMYIISKVKDIHITFSLTAFKTLLSLKTDTLLIQDILNAVQLSTSLLSSEHYIQDIQLEQLIHYKLLDGKIFSNVGLDVLNLKPCFFNLLKLVNSIKSLKSNIKYQDLIVEMSLSIYGQCFQPAEQDEIKEGMESSPFKDIESVEKFARCVQIISKTQTELSPETKLLFKSFVENLLSHQAYKQSNIILYQLMDILVNTSLIYDSQKLNQLNSYIRANQNTLFNNQEQDHLGKASSLSQSIAQNNNNGAGTKDKQQDIGEEDSSTSTSSNLKFSTQYQVCSYFRFASKYKFIKNLELDTIENLIQLLPKHNIKSFIYIYESILTNHSQWFMDDQNQLQTIHHLQDICYIVLKSIPNQFTFSINLCVSLRNYITNNNLALKQYKLQIVDLPSYKLSNVLKKTRNTTDANQNQEITNEDISNNKIIHIPFNVDFIKKISPTNKNLKLQLEQYLSLVNDAPLASKIKYILDQIDYQMSNNIPTPMEIFEIIRTNQLIRKELQINSNNFSKLKKYTIFLLQADYLESQTNVIIDNKSQIDSGKEGKNELDSPQFIEIQDSNMLNVNKINKQGLKVYSNTLFLVRVVLEQQPKSMDTEMLRLFIERHLSEMDLTGVLFSKQIMNTNGIKDSQIHFNIQKRLSQVIQIDQLNVKNALEMLKAFSLDDFDEKTLFTLENIIVTKLSLINLANIAVLSKKYYFKAKWNPIRIISGFALNIYKYVSNINNQSIWVFILLNKFKPQVFSTIKYEFIQFDRDNLSQENFMKCVQILIENDLNTLKSILPAQQHDINSQYYTRLALEGQTLHNQIQERKAILSNKVLEYSNKLKPNEENKQIKNDITILLLNKNVNQLHLNENNTIQYLVWMEYFQNKSQPFIISHETAQKAIGSLWKQYKLNKEITISQLLQGHAILNKLSNQSTTSLFTLKHITNLIESMVDKNRNGELSETPCLESILNLYQIATDFVSKEQSKIDDEQIDDLIKQVRSLLLYYKQKRNESKSIILKWIYLIDSNKQSSQRLAQAFNAQDLDILNKIEHIFIKRLESLDFHESIEIFNAFFMTELCSFQVIEACDSFLKDAGTRQEQLQQRVHSIQSHNNPDKMPIPQNVVNSNKRLSTTI